MKILIICTHFPPDTAIAAKRPYMFAKYLSDFGHEVTVLCSGRIIAKKDNSYNEKLNKFRVIAYLEEKTDSNSPATPTLAHRNSSLIPVIIRDSVKNIYHALYEPIDIYRKKRLTAYHFDNIKIKLEGLKDEHFDVVFSTFSELSNVYAGAYAKEMFKCKWILDFRDRIVQLSHSSWLWNILYRPVERKYIDKADAVTAVSEDLFFGSPYSTSKIHAIYNGYEPLDLEKNNYNQENKLSFCYTGMVYGERALALNLLFKVIADLIDKDKIENSKITFEYAGPSGEEVFRMASKYKLESIVHQHGYLLSNELAQLQLQSDIFLVLSWNHKNERGVLTGKFYDGIRIKKPILSVIVGETPDSELSRLNEKYHYGFCYEQAQGNQQNEDFEQFILNLYDQKIEIGRIDYQINESFIDRFKYENLTKELELLCQKILNNETI